jgi:hypothetical protein
LVSSSEELMLISLVSGLTRLLLTPMPCSPLSVIGVHDRPEVGKLEAEDDVRHC